MASSFLHFHLVLSAFGYSYLLCLKNPPTNIGGGGLPLLIVTEVLFCWCVKIGYMSLKPEHTPLFPPHLSGTSLREICPVLEFSKSCIRCLGWKCDTCCCLKESVRIKRKTVQCILLLKGNAAVSTIRTFICWCQVVSGHKMLDIVKS